MKAQVPHIRTKLPGPKARKWIAQDSKFISPSYTRVYPLVAHRAEGLEIEDIDGNVFLDLTAGIAVNATGHCHPEIVQTIRHQAGELIHMSGTDFYYLPQIQLAKKLCSITPGSFPKMAFFCNSGAEANEAAIKLARYATGRPQIIAFFGSFHGRTAGALSLTASKPVQQKGYFPLLPGVHHVPFPNSYRHPRAHEEGAVADEIIAQIDRLLHTKVPSNEVAAIFVEPIQGEGGYVVPPLDFHKKLRKLCDSIGALLVFDEVQSGMGRTGKMFAAQHFGIAADIVTMAKGIASGLPLGACVAKAALMKKWVAGSHASTFGGNPVSCAAALKTIELLEGGLIKNASNVGNYMKLRLSNMKRNISIIGDVRGFGLMLGIEIVHDSKSQTPDPELCNKIVQRCYHEGLLILSCGKNTLRLCPSLTISQKEATVGLDILERILIENSKGRR